MEVLRLAICKVYPVTHEVPYMRSNLTQDIMSANASLSNEQAHQFLAADDMYNSELDTTLVTAQTNNKLYGVVHGNTSGMSQLQLLHLI